MALKPFVFQKFMNAISAINDVAIENTHSDFLTDKQRLQLIRVTQDLFTIASEVADSIAVSVHKTSDV